MRRRMQPGLLLCRGLAHEHRECVSVAGVGGEERVCNGAHAGMCVSGSCSCYDVAG